MQRRQRLHSRHRRNQVSSQVELGQRGEAGEPARLEVRDLVAREIEHAQLGESRQAVDGSDLMAMHAELRQRLEARLGATRRRNQGRSTYFIKRNQELSRCNLGRSAYFIKRNQELSRCNLGRSTYLVAVQVEHVELRQLLEALDGPDCILAEHEHTERGDSFESRDARNPVVVPDERGTQEGAQRALRGHSEGTQGGSQRGTQRALKEAVKEAVVCAQVEEDEVRQRVEVADLGDCVVLVVEQPEPLLALQ